ncbi:hypothetical protein Ancab_025902 [Ancistrocladus abbreviatus]
MKGWGGGLGVVETILEEEIEDLHEESSDLLSPPLSSDPSSTPDFQSSVDAWTLRRGRKPDVKIHVQGTCFNLHKDVLSSRSGYMKRQLTEISELVLSPPLKITAETFKLIAEFCYSNDVIITPFTVAALRTAAEMLEMTGSSAGKGRGDGDSLRQKTESYFCLVVAVNRDFASIVFQSCLSLLPEAEELAFLASRCLQVLCSAEEEGDTVVVTYADGIKTVRPEDFLIIADSMQRRFARSHDFLYTVVDLYLKVYSGKMSEDLKAQICNCIDCNMLSPQLLMHAVQNSRMPLRFVVQAMLTEQLNTHRSIFTAITTATSTNHLSSRHELPLDTQSVTTLGAILQRDAALRQVAQLKAAIDTTTSRIQSLEKELSGMKKRLIDSERRRNVVDSSRSASCRFSKETSNRIERGEKGSVSSGNLRYGATAEEKGRAILEGSTATDTEGPRPKKSTLSQILMKGLKGVFRVPTYSVSKDSKVGAAGKEGGDENGDGNRDGGEITDLAPSHNRSSSVG